MSSYTQAGKFPFAGVLLSLLPGWQDITEDLAPGSPFTLARHDGLGALQFSTARATGGPSPNFTESALRDLLSSFTARAGGEVAHDSFTQSEGAMLLEARFVDKSDRTLLVWYCATDRDLCFITYLSERPGAATEAEVFEARAMVQSIDPRR